MKQDPHENRWLGKQREPASEYRRRLSSWRQRTNPLKRWQRAPSAKTSTFVEPKYVGGHEG